MGCSKGQLSIILLTCSYLYLYEVLVMKSSFSSLHSAIQDTEIFTEIFDDLNSLVTCSDVSAHRLFHGIMLCQFDNCFEILSIK